MTSRLRQTCDMEARSYQMSSSASFQLTEIDPDTASVRSGDTLSHPNKTVVSIVIDENELNTDTEKERKKQNDRDKTYDATLGFVSRTSNT